MLTSSKNTKWTQSSLTLTFGRGVSLLLLSITLGGVSSSLKARTDVVSVSITEIVAATLILEAGGEADPRAMAAVREVIANRAKGKSEISVCLAPKQFSCWNWKNVENTIAKAKKHPKWAQALALVKGKTNFTNGATHYHTKKVSPIWKKKLAKTTSIGQHIFYK